MERPYGPAKVNCRSSVRCSAEKLGMEVSAALAVCLSSSVR